MTDCAQCKEPNAEFFDADGRSVCRRCFYAGQMRDRDQRAREATVEEVPEALRGVVKLGSRRGRNTAPNQPGTLMRQGIKLTAVGLVLVPVAAFIETGVLFALAVVGFGFVTTVRGYKLRHYM